MVDRQGVTVIYNRQAGLNDGLEPHEVIGKHLLAVFPSLTEETSTLLKVLATGEPILRQEQTFANYKGNRVTTVNSTWPIYQGDQLVGAVEISKDLTRVRELSEQVVDLQAELLRKKRRKPAVSSAARYTLDDLVGRNARLEAVKMQALRAARGSSPVLVYGETGTGKELLVHAIHAAGPRRTGPLVAQNCAALPEGLLEGILFGTAKGGFTGAEDRPGLFELADGGTLYLDEINSMALELQAKLLRVLQDGRVRRVGATGERAVDVRVIASTNEPPLEAVAGKRLRQDLFYRLNVVYLELPPLRDRRDDIALLSRYFLAKHRALNPEVTGLAEPVQRFFATYGWPGNVRELEHAIEAGLHMAKGTEITLEDLPVHLQRAAGITPGDGMAVLPPVSVAGGELKAALAATEREAVLAALTQTGWNLSQTARLLGMPRQTLQYRIRILGLKRPDLKERAE